LVVSFYATDNKPLTTNIIYIGLSPRLNFALNRAKAVPIIFFKEVAKFQIAKLPFGMIKKYIDSNGLDEKDFSSQI
jgi:hypothetical protein